MGNATLHLASKLKLTSVALGCPTTKDLCRRFSEANPDTLFTLQNSYKWLNGKARPRMPAIYEDWSAVLGGALTPPFLTTASFDEFAAELGRHFFLSAEAVAALRVEDPASLPQQLWSRDHILSGLYLAVSPAWSRAEPDRLIVGSLAIGSGGDERDVQYRERLFGRSLTMRGQLVLDGRTAQTTLTCEATGALIMIALGVPAPPGNLAGGMLCGIALHDPESRPTASRIVFVRSRRLDWEGLLERSRYIGFDAAAFADDLAAIGYGGPGLAAAATGIVDYFGEGPRGRGSIVDAPAATLAGLALDLDRLVAA